MRIKLARTCSLGERSCEELGGGGAACAARTLQPPRTVLPDTRLLCATSRGREPFAALLADRKLEDNIIV